MFLLFKSLHSPPSSPYPFLIAFYGLVDYTYQDTLSRFTQLYLITRDKFHFLLSVTQTFPSHATNYARWIMEESRGQSCCCGLHRRNRQTGVWVIEERGKTLLVTNIIVNLKIVFIQSRHSFINTFILQCIMHLQKLFILFYHRHDWNSGIKVFRFIGLCLAGLKWRVNLINRGHYNIKIYKNTCLFDSYCILDDFYFSFIMISFCNSVTDGNPSQV